jgi:hypothetical protein
MSSKMLRRLSPAGMLATLLLTVAPPATAQADLNNFTLHFDAGVACPNFPLDVVGTNGIMHEKDFTDKNGNTIRSLIAGKGVILTYTNASTSKSVTFKTAGSVQHLTYYPSGRLKTFEATGHNGVILFPTDSGGPSTTQYTGHVVFDIEDTPDGRATLRIASGPKTDVCAAVS